MTTTPDDRRFDETDEDRRMTDADHAALDADRTTDAGEPGRTTDLGDADRTTDTSETDRTTDLGETDRSTDLGDADRTTDTRADQATTTDRGVEWTAAGNQPDTSTQPLVAEDVAVDFRTRWEVIQQGFVDDPRNSVSEADKLVDDLLKRLSASFEEQHQGLEKQWSDGEPSTEDLRSALQKYRAFFQRLLAM
ncbi:MULTISPECIES: hypothetical protein [unclassified Kribbella]|uniref:hypothetical protein n=1 Tax=unclassified Kribbella TaxID=2644121 RepID=UPI0030171BDD